MASTPAENLPEALLHDGSRLVVQTVGEGPPVLAAVRTAAYPPHQVATMRQWGADPTYGQGLADGLADSFRVVTADYEGHRMAHPAPESLTPANLAADLLAVADAAGVDRFAYYGYSWLALAGLQLAIRTDRVNGLVMGGFPPLQGPYAEMLAVTRAAHDLATARDPGADSPEVAPGDWDNVSIQADPAQTRQFVTLYEALRNFDDQVSTRLSIPALCFAGEQDNIVYGPSWGDVRVAMADPLRSRRADLESSGWTVRLLPGLDHLTAMHADVVVGVVKPVLARWLLEVP
jgi:pimeloyl-ACP methyl ester carboxylesterase